ncbi:MAG: insulinase family protein, partial [Maricaulaceae bacterium]
FQRTWLRPDNATVFVVGDTTLEEITPILERAFRRWNAPSDPIPTKNIAEIELPDSPRVILIDRPGAPQSQILAAHLAPPYGSDRDLAIDTFNDALGGLFTSRINMNLREDKAWSYGARSQFVSAVGQRPFMISAPVQTDRTGDSLREIIRELDEINAGNPVTTAEMDASVANAVRALPGQYETSSAVLSSLVSAARYGRPLDYAATVPEQLEGLTLDEVRAVGQDIIHPNALVWLIVGDLDEIEEQVAEVGIAPIEIWDADGNVME